MTISVPPPSFRSSHSYLAVSLTVLASCSVVACCPTSSLETSTPSPQEPGPCQTGFRQRKHLRKSQDASDWGVRLTFAHRRLECLPMFTDQKLGKAVAIANSLDADPFSREAQEVEQLEKQAEHLFSSFPWQTEVIAVADGRLFWAWWMITNILRSFSLNVTVGSCPYYQNGIILAVNYNNKTRVLRFCNW